MSGGLAALWRRWRAWRNRCRTCESDAIYGSLIAEFPELVPVERMKRGQLYRCSKCGGTWLLNESKDWLRRIPQDDVRRLREWNRSQSTLEEPFLAVLAAIGGIATSPDVIGVPCAVETRSGLRLEKAVVYVCKIPLGGYEPPTQTLFPADIASVAASPFALPLDVRRASFEKADESMGFAPVGVVDGKGREYTLACISDFFDKDAAKGEEMRLSGRTRRWPKVVWPEAVQAVVFVDWFEGCESRLASRSARSSG